MTHPLPPVVYHDHRPIRNLATISKPVIKASDLQREAERARKRHQ